MFEAWGFSIKIELTPFFKWISLHQINKCSRTVVPNLWSIDQKWFTMHYQMDHGCGGISLVWESLSHVSQVSSSEQQPIHGANLS